MEITPEFASEIVKFRSLNANACDNLASPHDINVASEAALLIVRANSDVLAQHFASRLAGMKLAVDTQQIQFNFGTEAEAAETFKMAVRQSVEEKMARAISLSSMNIFLFDLKYPSMYGQDDDEDLKATFMIAHAADGYRRRTAWAFMEEALVRQKLKSQRRNSWITGILMAIASVFVLYAVAG